MTHPLPRVRLRAHGRALGDVLHQDDTQAIDHLASRFFENWLAKMG